MLPKRSILAAPFLGLLATAYLLDGATDELKKIAEGVWFLEGDLKNYGHCNNTIIEMSDYLIVIDANFPSGAELVLAQVKKISKKPIKYVFDTHHHGDHAYANALWTKLGATTIGHIEVVNEMKAREPERWLSTAKQRKDVAALNLPTAEPPKLTFDKSPHVITDGKRKLELHHFGWAHTKGDGFAWLPKEKILCTGDAAVNGAFNYTADANISNWPKVMEGALKLKPLHVLPGHGPAGGPEILNGQRAYMLELGKAVASAVKSGKKLEDIVTLKDGKAMDTTIKLPEAVRNWVGSGLAGQVQDAFEEQTQRKPRGDLKL